VHKAVSQLHQLKHLCGTIIQLPLLQFPIPEPNIDRFLSGCSGTGIFLELREGELVLISYNRTAVLNKSWIVMAASLFDRELFSV
jgi:hypothetical protein